MYWKFGKAISTIPMTEEQIEFRQQWSSAAGKLAAMELASAEVMNRAGRAFVRGEDRTAEALRELGKHFEGHVKTLKIEVDSFIKRANS